MVASVSIDSYGGNFTKSNVRGRKVVCSHSLVGRLFDEGIRRVHTNVAVMAPSVE